MIHESNICFFSGFSRCRVLLSCLAPYYKQLGSQTQCSICQGNRKKLVCDLHPQNLWLPYAPWPQAKFWLSGLLAAQLTKG